MDHGIGGRQLDDIDRAAVGIPANLVRPGSRRATHQRADEVPVTAPKSYFGNLGAGGGVVELAASVLALREGREPDLDKPLDRGVEVELGVVALLPNDYVPDVHLRLVL